MEKSFLWFGNGVWRRTQAGKDTELGEIEDQFRHEAGMGSQYDRLCVLQHKMEKPSKHSSCNEKGSFDQ